MFPVGAAHAVEGIQAANQWNFPPFACPDMLNFMPHWPFIVAYTLILFVLGTLVRWEYRRSRRNRRWAPLDM
jgi:hypothetical protein